MSGEIILREDHKKTDPFAEIHTAADILYADLVSVRSRFVVKYSVIDPLGTGNGLAVVSALEQLDDAFGQYSDSSVSAEKRIRGITDVLTRVAQRFTPEIPELFTGYVAGPKYNGKDYLPESNVQGYSTRIEPAILFALQRSAEGKHVVGDWNELVAINTYGEDVRLGPRPDFTSSAPVIIDGESRPKLT